MHNLKRAQKKTRSDGCTSAAGRHSKIAMITSYYLTLFLMLWQGESEDYE
jgi:hypothetical protein